MLDIARAVFTQSEYRRTADQVRPAVQARDALAMELTFRTLLVNQADADAFLTQVMDMRGPGRNEWRVRVPASVAEKIVVGQTITLQHSRFGLAGGKDFIVKGVSKNMAQLLNELTLYGPK